MAIQNLKFLVKFLEDDGGVDDYEAAVYSFFNNLETKKFVYTLSIGRAKESYHGNRCDFLKEMVVSFSCQNIKNNVDIVNFASHVNKLWCREAQNNCFIQWLHPDINYTNPPKFIPSGDLRLSEIAFGNLVGMKLFVQNYRFREIEGSSCSFSSIICSFDHLQKTVCFYISSKHKPDCSKQKPDCSKQKPGEMGYKLCLRYDSIIRVLADVSENKTCAEFYLQLKHPPLISECITETADEFVLQAKVTKAKQMVYGSEKFERSFQIGCSCNNTIYQCKQMGKNLVLKMFADDKCQSRWNLDRFTQTCAEKVEVYYTSVNIHLLAKKNRVQMKNISSVLSKSGLSDADKFKCQYAWAVVHSRSDAILNQIDMKNNASEIQLKVLELVNKNVSVLIKSLYFIADLLDRGVIFDFFSHLHEKSSFFCQYKQQDTLPVGMINVRRVIITPSRLIFLQPHEHFENRIIRQFGSEYMIRASVKDDDYSKLTFAVQYNSKKDEIIEDIVGLILNRGIHIGLRHYEFLAASTSQLREHGFWMCAKDENSNTASSIRHWMGDFSRIKNAAKYMARMGQCFSSIESAVQVHIGDDDEKLIEDIKTKDERYTFSDGIGIITSDLAEEIRAALFKISSNSSIFYEYELYKPVAFQIRYKGCKGMVVEYPEKGRKLYIRPSMKKFECSTSYQLEIVKASGPSKLYLNKHLITILEQMGVHQEVFMLLEINMIIELLESLMEETAAAHQLLHTLPCTFSYSSLLNAGFSLTGDPFFRSLLLACFKLFSEKLRTKMRIAVPFEYGRNMLGVLDETRTLKYGQVFIQYSRNLMDPNAGCSIHEGPVIVTKNPTLHPGDVRKLMAVDIPKLHHIKDCIVFPAKGKRPHPDEMAGSDLDGDEMIVLWYEPLIFKRNNFKPMNYPVYQEKFVKKNIQLQDMVNFFCKYIQNDNIGIFANAHLVWADRLKDGIFSKKCMDIAQRYPYVLDFAKHGTTKVLKQSERPNQYPDFCEKGLLGNTYHSEKALGSLYRISRVLEACSSKINLTYESSSYDPDLEYSGWEVYRDSADGHAHEFTIEMLEILNRYSFNSEAEAFSGIIQPHILKRMNQNISDTTKIINMYLQTILSRYRSIFMQELEEECQTQKVEGKQKLALKYCRASAWYMVTYKHTNPKVLSFPWVVSDILADIKSIAGKIKKNLEIKSSFLQNIDSDIIQWNDGSGNDDSNCFCNYTLEKVSLKWIDWSGINIGKKANTFCDDCYQRIFNFYISKRDLLCCSQLHGRVCTCQKYCSPSRLVLHFLKFFLTTVLEPNLGQCSVKYCDGFKTKNLQELSLQTYCYLAVTQNIFYLGLPFKTENCAKKALSSDMFDEGFGEPIKIHADPDLQKMVENHNEDICSILMKRSGVKDITLTPAKNSVCVSTFGKNWQRWNLKEILLNTHFTANLKTLIECSCCKHL